MSIKVERARKLSEVGRYPATYAAVLASLSPEVVAALSSRLLARLLDDVWASWKETKRLHEADIVAEGAVWDAGGRRLRGIAA